MGIETPKKKTFSEGTLIGWGLTKGGLILEEIRCIVFVHYAGGFNNETS